MLKVIDVSKGIPDGEKNVVIKSTWKHVEEPFRRLVRDDSEIFRDTESLELMRAIDGAERTGEFGVITPYGKSCITCLSSGCKAGLLILDCSRKGLVPIVDADIAGDNVWEWLHENAEISVKASGFSMLHLCNLTGVHADTEFITDEWEAKQMTPEREQKAYERYVRIFGDPSQRVKSGWKEVLPFMEYIKRFGGNEWIPETAEELACSTEFTIVNTVPYMWDKASARRVPVYTFGGKDGRRLIVSELSVKYPTVPEIIFPDMIAGTIDYGTDAFVPFAELYDGKVTSVVLDCEEYCDPHEYTDYVWFCVETDPETKTATIYL